MVITHTEEYIYLHSACSRNIIYVYLSRQNFFSHDIYKSSAVSMDEFTVNLSERQSHLYQIRLHRVIRISLIMHRK